MIAMLAFAIAAASPAATPTQKPYHVYEVPASSQPEVYRIRIGDDAAKVWDVEQIQSVSIYDNAGQRLGCEQLRMSRLGATKKSYPLIGTWRSTENDVAITRRSFGRLNFAWRFSMPPFAENESPSVLAFDWRSTVDRPGEVRLIEVPPDKNAINRADGTYLNAMSSDPRRGHLNLSLYTPTPKAWSSEADLMFTVSQDELTLESPTLETLTKKPWTLIHAGGPGWILFGGNGRAPYRLQLGDTLYGCGGIGGLTDFSKANTDPEWPPELKVGAEIANAPHMGETQTTFNDQLDQRVLGNWFGWAAWVVVAFLVALCVALMPEKPQPRN